jgi:iron complex outermembrane receptor protein
MKRIWQVALVVALGGGAALTTTSAWSEEAAAPAAQKPTAVEEIIVTSRRREESVQDVPLSVTAFNAEQIEEIKPTTLRDFDGFVPNVYIGMGTAGPSQSAIFIRGVGYADVEKTQSPQVGVIVDGLQMGSNTGQLIDAFDMETVEVNRGPQGVLFGKNTIGGNIVVTRVRPQFNEFGFQLSGEAGNYESTNFKGRVNIPLIDDRLALKVGAIDRERDGYYDNKTLGGSAGDIDYAAQTASLRWAATDTLEFQLTYDRIDDNSQIPPQDPRFNGSDPFENLADKREPTSYEVNQWGLQAQWALGDFVINSITGLHDGTDVVNQDFDGGSINGTAFPFAQLHTLRDQEFELFTQELRLSGPLTDSIDFMVGGYYYDSDLDFTQRTNNVIQVPIGLPDCALAGLRNNPTVGAALCQFPNARSIQESGVETESWAAFGSLTFRPWENLEIMAGARYIDEETDFESAFFDFSDGTFDTGGPEQEFDFSPYPETVGTAFTANDSWSDTIFTASVNWAITDSNRAYLTYAEGFRSGGFSIRSAQADTAAFDPEDAYQVEVGLKNEFFDNRLRANFALFFLSRDMQQFSSIIPLPPGFIPGTTTIINNGGESEYTGAELELTWLATDSITLVANGGVIDVDNKAFALPCEIVDGCVTADPTVFDPPGTPRELGDNDLSRQPEWNFSIQALYEREIGAGLFSMSAGYRRVGEFLLVNTGGGADQMLFEGPYDLVDAHVSYTWNLSSGDAISVSAFGKNLTDTEYLEQALFLGGFNTGFQGWGAPRTYAVEVRYSH